MPAPTFAKNGAFKLRRPRVITSGFEREPDAFVAQSLEELDQILGRRLWRDEVVVHAGVDFDEDGQTDAIMQGEVGAAELAEVLDKPLEAKRPGIGNGHWWPAESLLADLAYRDEGDRTLGDVINQDADLSTLEYQFTEDLAACYHDLSYNSRVVLSDRYPNIIDYLVARAWFAEGARNLIGLRSTIYKEGTGLLAVVEDYAVLTGARLLTEERQINVDGINKAASPIVTAILDAHVDFGENSFEDQVNAIINNLVYNGDEIKLITDTLGPLPPATISRLVAAVRGFTIPITQQNAKQFLPSLLTHVTGDTLFQDGQDSFTPATPDTAYDVDFINVGTGLVQVNKESVRAAAQLFYCMVLGDELEVFDSVNYLTHKLLLRESVPLDDPQLRKDLQDYVFSNRFTVKRSHRWEQVDRSRPAERYMFYRQVFGSGGPELDGQADMGDAGRNHDYQRLWKVLMLESAKYLERASLSPTADSYVSPQPIQQAVEDLQYNLSNHSTGMATVISPLIYEELTFVTKRILMHPEILRWLAPQGGTWWRVVERIHLAMKGRRSRATVLNSKAEYGYSIVRSIADYNASTFTDDAELSRFLSNVDAFIITQSILQESLTDDLKEDDGYQDHMAAPGLEHIGNGMPDHPSPPMSSAGAGGGRADAWDF